MSIYRINVNVDCTPGLLTWPHSLTNDLGAEWTTFPFSPTTFLRRTRKRNRCSTNVQDVVANFCTIFRFLFKCKQMCDTDHANCFEQKVRFSSCLTSSFEACVQVKHSNVASIRDLLGCSVIHIWGQKLPNIVFCVCLFNFFCLYVLVYVF